MSCSTTLSKKLLYSLGIAFGYRDIPHFLPFIPSRPKSSIPTFHRTETPKHHQNPYHHLPSQPWNPHCKIIRKRVERKVNKKQLHQVNFPPAPATIIVQSKLVFPFLSFDDAVSIVVSCSQNIPTPHLSLFSLKNAPEMTIANHRNRRKRKTKSWVTKLNEKTPQIKSQVGIWVLRARVYIHDYRKSRKQ